MIPAVSNIALPEFDHTRYLEHVRSIGFKAIEVAPSRVWPDFGTEHVRPSDVARYRQQLQRDDLKVCGLHSLFFDRPDLSIFADQRCRDETVAFLVRLSEVCRDLGGQTLVFGSPRARSRGSLPKSDAEKMAIEFFLAVAARIEGHNTTMCIEPLPVHDSDFVNSIKDAYQLTNSVGHKSFKLHLDLRAMKAAGDIGFDVRSFPSADVAHVHINADDLGALDQRPEETLKAFRFDLDRVGYARHVSLEQRMIDGDDILGPLQRSYVAMCSAGFFR